MTLREVWEREWEKRHGFRVAMIPCGGYEPLDDPPRRTDDEMKAEIFAWMGEELSSPYMKPIL